MRTIYMFETRNVLITVNVNFQFYPESRVPSTSSSSSVLGRAGVPAPPLERQHSTSHCRPSIPHSQPCHLRPQVLLEQGFGAEAVAVGSAILPLALLPSVSTTTRRQKSQYCASSQSSNRDRVPDHHSHILQNTRPSHDSGWSWGADCVLLGYQGLLSWLLRRSHLKVDPHMSDTLQCVKKPLQIPVHTSTKEKYNMLYEMPPA